MFSGKTILIIATALAIVACLIIVGHFATRPTESDPFAQLTDLNVPALTPPSPPSPVEPKPEATPAQVPPPPPEPKAETPAPTLAPPTLKASTQTEGPKQAQTAPIIAPMPPRRLAPGVFVYEPIPHDAPVAEFPLVLVWQKDREWYRIRDFDLNGELSPSEWDTLGRLKAGFFGAGRTTNRPSVVPPTEESPSGL